MQDSQIIELYFRRSERAIEETASKYGSYLSSIAYNILYNKEDAEECVSDTYLAAWNRIPPTKPTHFSVFLGTITRTMSIDRWRKTKAAKRGKGQIPTALHELGYAVPSEQNMEEDLIRSELTASINRFLRDLPDIERRIFICRYWYFDSIPDISRQYSLSQSKVKSTLMRTRRKLKSYLIEKGAVEA